MYTDKKNMFYLHYYLAKQLNLKKVKICTGSFYRVCKNAIRASVKVMLEERDDGTQLIKMILGIKIYKNKITKSIEIYLCDER